MVSHCIAEYSNNIKLIKVSVIEENDGFSLDLKLSVDYMLNNPEVFAKIQSVVKENIEQFTGIPILKVDINISETRNF